MCPVREEDKCLEEVTEENEELHTATLPPDPANSTPCHSSGPPSLQEEISRHDNSNQSDSSFDMSLGDLIDDPVGHTYSI